MTAMKKTARYLLSCAAAASLAAAAACASAPPAARAPGMPFEQKMAWILQLEDQRILKVEVPPPVVPPPTRRGRAATPPPAPPSPDLAVLIADVEPRIRRRAALAIGRTGLREGVPLLVPVQNASPESQVHVPSAAVSVAPIQ